MNADTRATFKQLVEVTRTQANDEALWVHPEVASEAYTQNALRDIHTALANYLESVAADLKRQLAKAEKEAHA